MIDWLNSAAFTAFGAATSWAEVLGFATGALCVWLVAQQVVWNWPIGIANNLLWIVLFASAGLYADSGLQVVYIALGLWGWYLWMRGGTGSSVLPVSGTTRFEGLRLAVAGVLGTVGLMVFLDSATDSSVPFWDALTTVISLLATWGQAKKKWESWLLWITADVIYVPLYAHKDLTLTALLYFGFLALCVKGLLEWRSAMRTSAAEPVPVP